MIIDVHTSLWESPDQLGPQVSATLRERSAGRWGQADAGPRAHAAAMKSVDVSFVLGFRSLRLGADVPNALIASHVSREPNHRIGFAGIDPMADDFLDELDAAIGMKLSGVSISPAAQDFHPLHTRAIQLYERCQAMGLPLVVQQAGHLTRDARMSYAQPHLFDDVARDFPQLRVLITHLGFPWVDQTLVLANKHPNVYTEPGMVAARPWQLYNALLQARQLEGMDRVLFGSNFPHNTPEEAIATLYSLNRFAQGSNLPSIPRGRLRAVVERDSLTCLGLRPGPEPLPTRPARIRWSVDSTTPIQEPVNEESA